MSRPKIATDERVHVRLTPADLEHIEVIKASLRDTGENRWPTRVDTVRAALRDAAWIIQQAAGAVGVR